MTESGRQEGGGRRRGTPLVLDPLAAARVDRSPDTARCYLADVFHALDLTFPGRVTFGVYFVLTGLHGPADPSGESLAPDDTVTCHRPVRVADPDPLAVASARATSTNVTIAGPGAGRLRITSAGRVPAERPIPVGRAEARVE